jgi:hypothetical protein
VQKEIVIIDKLIPNEVTSEVTLLENARNLKLQAKIPILVKIRARVRIIERSLIETVLSPR